MINFSPVWALVLRHSRLWMRDTNLILVMLYWPLLDILVWGFLGAWIQQTQCYSTYNYQTVALLAIVLWQTTCRSSINLTYSLMEEIKTHNLVNLFSMPLRITQWIMGVILFDLFLSIINMCYCIGLIVWIYGLPISSILKPVYIFAPPLFISGLALGFICLQIIIYLGKRAEELSFVIAWFFAPFSTAFYPLEVLPPWAKTISYSMPMSYIFEGMRAYMTRHEDPTFYLIQGYVMALLYVIVGIIGFIVLFNKTKDKGLTRLSD